MTDAQGGQRALYYPDMLPPERWMKQALLVNDSISSISHPVLQNRGSVHDRRWQGRYALFSWLQDQGYWYPQAVGLFRDRDSYSKEVSAALQTFVKPIRFRFRTAEMSSQYIRLYLGKLTYDIETLLSARRVAKRLPDGDLLIPLEVGRVVLAITAKYLAREALRDYGRALHPQTDQADSLDHGYGEVASLDRHRCRELLWRGLLPVPSGEVSFDDIVQFRQHHRMELLRLRHEIETLITQVRDNPDPMDAIHAARQGVELAIMEVSRAARSRRLRLVAANATVVLTGSVSGALMSQDSLSLVYGGFGAGALAALGSRIVRGHAGCDSPYGYLVRAQQTYG